MLVIRRWMSIGALTSCMICTLWYLSYTRGLHSSVSSGDTHIAGRLPFGQHDNVTFHWTKMPEHYPVTSIIPLPSGRPAKMSRIQHDFLPESQRARSIREQRLRSVRASFIHSWEGYKRNAWMRDEVAPVTGGYRNTFGGWSATLIDTLDTLWIVGLKNDFEMALRDVANIDFTTTEEGTLNVFETTIRYLGGLLSAYDISDGKYPILLEKASELGEMLYAAFDTPNRMPVTRWDWRSSAMGKSQEADVTVLVAELGSLTLEFTRLSQLTGDPRFYDAVQRITNEFDKHQQKTRLPGMWPVIINAKQLIFDFSTFTLGGMSDSMYEYLPKQHMMLGGLTQQYRKLYEASIDVIIKNIFYRPLTQNNQNVLLSGSARVNSLNKIILDPQAQHLACFAGGMVGIGAKIFERPGDLTIARKLVDGCIWAYNNTITGIMPETFHTASCEDPTDCEWDQQRWYSAVASRQTDFSGAATSLTPSQRVEYNILTKKLTPGFTDIGDRRYILRYSTLDRTMHRAESPPNIVHSLIRTSHTDRKLSNPSSSSTVSPATSPSKTTHGKSSKPSKSTPAPKSPTPLSTTSL